MNTVIPFPKTTINGSPNGTFHRTAAACRAFTLIELLVVIAIIAILAGLAFPAVQGALGSGKKAQARNDVAQLVAAVKAFQLEYGRLPTTTAGSDAASADNAAVVTALTLKQQFEPPRHRLLRTENRQGQQKRGRHRRQIL